MLSVAVLGKNSLAMLDRVIIAALILFAGVAPVAENIMFKALVNKRGEPDVSIHLIRHAAGRYQPTNVKLDALCFIPPQIPLGQNCRHDAIHDYTV